MVAPIHQEPSDRELVPIVPSLFFSDAYHHTWLLTLGFPFNRVHCLDDGSEESRDRRAQWDATVNGIKAIENPLATVFVLGTNTDTKQTKIIAGFDVTTETEPAMDGYTWVSRFDDPAKLVSTVRTILTEMGAIP